MDSNISFNQFKKMISENVSSQDEDPFRSIAIEVAAVERLLARDSRIDPIHVKRRLNRLRACVKRIRLDTDKRLYARNHAIRVLASRLRAAERLSVRKAVKELG